MIIMRRFIFCVQLLVSVCGVTAAPCPDGSDGLTKALYEAGNETAYKDVTCIPYGEFAGYTRDVTLNGLRSLKSIGVQAFSSFDGKLTFTGNYPALGSIGQQAFYMFRGTLTFTGEYPALGYIGGKAFCASSRSTIIYGNADSVIALNGLPSLYSVGERAFQYFLGKLTIFGEYPALVRIESYAFDNAGNANSEITFNGLQRLNYIGQYAFYNFGGAPAERSSGKLTITGEFPALSYINDNAFSGYTSKNQMFAGNADSTVRFTGLPSLTLFGKGAFYRFSGTLTITGEYPALEKIDREAFYNAGNAESVVAIACSSPAELFIDQSAFDDFKGSHNRENELTWCPVPCPDGSAGLTKALYEDGNVTAYKDVTCIKDGEFRRYTKAVTLTGLQSLQSIGYGAFSEFSGTLTFTGEYPALETIASRAFNMCRFGQCTGNVDSVITFNGLPSLKSIGREAFYKFGGNLTITGEYPALETFDQQAFYSAANADSIITFAGLPSLQSIGESAFRDFKGKLAFTGEYPALRGIGGYAFYKFGGKLTVTGEYPALYTIDQNAFEGAGNADSVVAFDGLPSLYRIREEAFQYFGGKLTFTGGCPALVAIGQDAFYEAGNADSAAITFNGLQSLRGFGKWVFRDYKGKLTITGEYPALVTIDTYAFGTLGGNADSVIEFNGLPSLKIIGGGAFYQYGGKLTITGEYPALERIDNGAFFNVGNADSIITFNGLPSLVRIMGRAFEDFPGKLTITGEYPALWSIYRDAFSNAGTADSVIAIECTSQLGFQVSPSNGAYENSFKGSHNRENELTWCPVPCPDGSAGLTKALYEDGNVTAYKDVTCIKDGEFRRYTKAVTLTGLQSLQSIGYGAFSEFSGKLTFTGEYPALESIGSSAFNTAYNIDSVITLTGLPSLKSIGREAFYKFGGTFTITGEYPAFETMGDGAFASPHPNLWSSAGNADSVITFTGLPSLKSIVYGAFLYFGGTLTITGDYPALRSISENAFHKAGNAYSLVAIACSSPAGLTILSKAFNDFKGTRNATNELTQCASTTTITTSTTTTWTTTTATFTTGTTTTATFTTGTTTTTTFTTGTTTTTTFTTTTTTITTSTTTTTTTTGTTTTFTLTTTTTTTTLLPVNAECDPRNDRCDVTQDLSCDYNHYKCRYITTTIATTTTRTVTTQTETTTAASTTTERTETETTTTRTDAIQTETTTAASTTTERTERTTTASTTTIERRTEPETTTTRTDTTQSETTTTASTTTIERTEAETTTTETDPKSSATETSTSLSTVTVPATNKNPTTTAATTISTAPTTSNASNMTSDGPDNTNSSSAAVAVAVTLVVLAAAAAGVLLFVRKSRRRTQAAGAPHVDNEIEMQEQAASGISIGDTYTNPLAQNITADQHYGEVDPVEFKGIVFGAQIGETVLDEYIEVADEELPPGSRPAAWFVGGMDKEACKQLVRAGGARQFLVRTSKSVANGYVVCFNVDGTHVQEDVVRRRDDGQYTTRFVSKPFDRIKALILHWQNHKLEPKPGIAFMLGQPVPHGISKFIGDEWTLRCGASQLSATPLAEVMGVDPKIFFVVDDKVKAICDEFAKSGTDQDQENVARLLDETYRTPESNPADPPEHSPLSEVMLSKEVKDSNLQLEHALALQLYTTSCYVSINKHLRDNSQPNPFAITVYYISDALKRLRKYESMKGTTVKTRIYHRGMRNTKLSDQFMGDGGAEMACMSTTSSKAVALSFAGAKCPMLLKCISESFMTHGAEISFLSVYPGEKEVLYPPLTYLNPVRTYEEVVGKLLVTVVEVKPVYPN